MHNPSDLLLFLAVVDAGSLAGAARTMGITRSTAARRLASLEDSLGVQLIGRNTRTLSLTQAGEIYLEHARKVKRTLSEAEDDLQALTSKPRGHLRVSAPLLGAYPWLIPLAQGFMAAYPEISLEVCFGTDVKNLVAGRVDVGLQLGLESNANLRRRTLARHRTLLAAAPHYLEGRPPITCEADLAQHDCLFMRRADGTLMPWPRRGGGAIKVEAPRLVANALNLIHEAVVAGLGVGMLPWPPYQAAFEAKEVVPVLPEVVGQELVVSLVYSATRHTPPKVRAFIDYVAEFTEVVFLSAGAPRTCPPRPSLPRRQPGG